MDKNFLVTQGRILRGVISILLIGLIFSGCEKKPAAPVAQMVVLIGIDGMSPDGFQQAEAPNLDELVRSGAVSLNTRAVIPTISASNWASHLMGSAPEQHGVTFNGWTHYNSLIKPTESDTDGYYPSVFTVLKQQRPGSKTGLFHDWDDLPDLFNGKFIDTTAFNTSFHSTIQMASSWIIRERPEFTFIYIGHPDETGHKYRWDSKQIIAAIEEVDMALGGLFGSLKEAGLFHEIHFLVVSNHSGLDNSYGGISLDKIEVPWIIAGPGIVSNRLLSQPNNVFNTGSTIIRLFRLEQPESWIGRPVTGAFEGSPDAKTNASAYVPQPYASMASGYYSESDTLSFKITPSDLVIRYTLNGEDPAESSPVYSSPLLLMKNAIVKAAAFNEGHRSRITTVDFRIVKHIRSVELRHKPDPKHAGSGAYTLANLQTGTNDFNDPRWLGFEGVDLDATLMLDEMSDISRVMIGYLSDAASWIFPPENIAIIGSVDGKNYVRLGGMDEAQIRAANRKGRNQLSIPVTPAKLRYLKVYIANTGICPDGHPGEGEPAWLFVDEIFVQ